MEKLLYFILKGRRGPGNVILSPEQVLAAELMIGYYCVNGRLPLDHSEFAEDPGDKVVIEMLALRQKVCVFNSRNHNVINLESDFSNRGSEYDGASVHLN